MVTEIMGFLILLGAAIVFIVRWQSRKERHPEDMQQDMQYSTHQLKQELERTGSEITSRIEQHVMRLEQLIHEADRSKTVLDGRIAELRELVRLGEEQMDAMHTLRSEIVEARQLRQQLTETGRQAAAMMQGYVPPVERVDAQDFSEVLHRSMAMDEAMDTNSYQVPPERAHVFSSEATPQMHEPEPVKAPVYEKAPAAGEDEIPEEEPLREEPVITDSARVRTLLLNGRSVEDVARETGMGKGAVELMREMLRRQMGDESVAE